MSLWLLEQNRRPLLIRDFQPQNLGHEYPFSGGKGLMMSWLKIKVPSLTAFATDIATVCNWSFTLSSSSIRVFSSAVHFSLRSQSLGDVSDHLEYHPEAPRGHDATTACCQVEEVPLQATLEDPQSFLDNQWQVYGLCYCHHTFFAPVRLYRSIQ